MSSRTKKTSWIIAYDIASPRRLQRVHRYMKSCGIPLQYSVFMTRGNEAFLDRIMNNLALIINHRDDDVRAYPVPENPEIIWMGKRPMPNEVTLSLLPNLEEEMSLRGLPGEENSEEPPGQKGDGGEGGIFLC